MAVTQFAGNTTLAITELQNLLTGITTKRQFTLTSSTATTVAVSVVTSISTILWEPLTQTAAAQTVNLYVSSQTAGTSFTLAHLSITVTTQTFQYVVIG